MALLTPVVTLVVHPVDVEAHPSYEPGFRWAVMVGGRPPQEIEYCANAGHGTTVDEALYYGEPCAVTAVQALRMLGVPAEYRRLSLDRDPIPAGDERVHFLQS